MRGGREGAGHHLDWGWSADANADPRPALPVLGAHLSWRMGTNAMSRPGVTNPSIAIDVSISKTFPVDLQNYYFINTEKIKIKIGTFSEVSSEMFSYGLRKTKVRKDLR